jgi:hypothetical protein
MVPEVISKYPFILWNPEVAYVVQKFGIIACFKDVTCYRMLP